MTTLQKLIKCFAIVLAISLIVWIITVILNVIGFFTSKEDYKDVTFNPSVLVQNLDIELAFTNLTIETGNDFLVETNSKYINISEQNGKLHIYETKRLIKNKNRYSLKITIPSDYQFGQVNIEAGAGKIDINTLSANQLYMELGAGNVKMNNLNVIQKVDIDGGAGRIYMDGILNNLDFDMGIGEAIIKSSLYGYNDIDCGVGRLQLDLNDSADDYMIDVEKGIGSISFNGNSVSNNSVLGRGANRISIDGGIGAIEITTIS